MKRLVALGMVMAVSAACRNYDYRSRVSQDGGLMPAARYAQYGREQAQLVAAGRELAHFGADSVQQAAAYARGLPDVVDVSVDPQANWLTLKFKSGWRVATPPVNDGKRGTETAGLPPRQ